MSRYRVHIHDYADQGRWLAEQEFPSRPTREQVTAAFPVLSTPGRYEVRLGLLSGADEIHAGGWLQGEPRTGPATCADCGCTHPDPAGAPPHSDGNPYAQYTPEHRVWAKAQQHGQAAASWAVTYSDKARCREVLTGIRDGDPAVLDSIHAPVGDLSDGGDYTEDDLMADAGWVPHDGTALRSELAEQYAADVVTAFWHQVERDCIAALKTEPDELNDLMDIDHVISVDGDGIVTDASGVYAPELLMPVTSDGQILAQHEADYTDQARRQGWQLLSGWTGQSGYRGPVMHSSEYVGGGLARHILETPGQYVVTTVETDDDDEQAAGWVVLFRELPTEDQS